MKIPQELVDAMVAHAVNEHPIEACGILCGPGGVPTRIVAVENELDSETAYAFEPTQQLAVWEGVFDRGEKLAGFYYSHTRHEAYPSPRDVEHAVYDVPHLIISTKGGLVLRAFRVRDGVVMEESVEITSPAAGRESPPEPAAR